MVSSQPGPTTVNTGQVQLYHTVTTFFLLIPTTNDQETLTFGRRCQDGLHDLTRVVVLLSMDSLVR